MSQIVTSSAAPAAFTLLNSADIAPGTTGKLRRLCVWAMRPFKLELMTVQNATTTTHAIYGTPWEFTPPAGELYLRRKPNDPAAYFQIRATNLDTGGQTSNIFVTWFIDEI